MNSLLDEREKRYKRRKQDKKAFDKAIDLAMDNRNEMTLSVSAPKMSLSDTRIRLLDEGAVVGDGFIDCFIKKGTIEKFLNGENEHLDNIDAAYKGNVNLGHMDFATFPFIIGEWEKKDLHLVDIENDRKAVDVDLHLDYDSVFVKELARQPYDIGISAEFYYHVDQDATEELFEEQDVYVPVIDEILIKAYGLVGECGNVNSDGLELKGGQNMTDEKNLTLETEGELTPEENEVETAEVEEEIIEETIEALEVEAEAEEDEEETDTVEGESEEEDEEAEEAADEEVESDEDEDDEESDEEGEDALSELTATFDELRTANEELLAENKALKKQNRKLQKRLAATNGQIGEFTEKFKGLSMALGLKKETKEEVTTKNVVSDGIGD